MSGGEVPNAAYWAHYSRSVVIPAFTYLRQAIVGKVMPGFDALADEAAAAAEEEFDRLGQVPAFDDAVDMGDLAEQAQEEGLAYYEGMTSARQSILNVLATALYHLHEQQLLQFYRRALLGHGHGQRTDPGVLKASLAIEELRSWGIDSETGFEMWSAINELRLVANTVKHAYGASSEELRELRPEMFVNPLIREAFERRPRSSAGVYTPLAGEDFYVTLEDLDRYFEATVAFWDWLAQQIENL